jgi:hypothetical protein
VAAAPDVPGYGFSPNALRYLEHCLVCLDPLDASYGTKMELIAMLNGVVTTYVGNELATAERTRSLPWSAEQEQAMRIAYLGSRIATGAYPRMAAAFTQDAARSTWRRCSSGRWDGCWTRSNRRVRSTGLSDLRGQMSANCPSGPSS